MKYLHAGIVLLVGVAVGASIAVSFKVTAEQPQTVKLANGVSVENRTKVLNEMGVSQDKQAEGIRLMSISSQLVDDGQACYKEMQTKCTPEQQQRWDKAEADLKAFWKSNSTKAGIRK